MQIQLAIYDDVTGALVADWSTRAVSCHVTTSNHGYETCTAELRVSFYEAFLYYQQLGPLVLRVVWGSYKLWEGRLEDPTQFAKAQSGLKITAFGAWVALNDTPYTALWSNTSLANFTNENFSAIINATAQFSYNATNQLYATVQKGTILASSTGGGFRFQIPDQSTRVITGVSFDVQFNAAVGLTFFVQSRDSAGAIVANEVTLAGTAALLTRTYHTIVGANVAQLFFVLYNATGGAVTPAGETGAHFFTITNLRIVSASTNRINTTLGTIIAAGTRTVTPASMARIFVGQRLQISTGTAVSESVVVTAITVTTFTAVFAFAHVAADTVNAFVIYPDEIIKDIATAVDTLNPTQFNSASDLIQSQALDVDQLIIEDQTCTTVVNTLLAKSDTQARQWVGLVYDNQQLIVRPRGTGSAWYTDVATLEVVRSLTNLYNSVYAVYNDASNKRKLRTAVSTDVQSVTKFGLTRRTSIAVNSTDVIQAGKVRDTLLTTSLDPVPRTSITLTKIFDSRGNPFPIFYVRTDDTLTLRNLPPILGQVYDKIRTLVITHTDYDVVKGSLTLELEIPLPDQSILLARALTS